MQEKSAIASDGSKGRPRALVWPLAIFTVLAIVFAFALRTGDPSKLPSALIGKTAPAIELQGLEGLTDAGRPVGGFASSDLAKGQVSVVNFWASWCVPCADESGVLEGLWRRFGPQGLVVLGVDTQDLSGDARAFLRRHGVTYPSLRDGTDAAQQAYETTGVPETFLIDSGGRIAVPIRGPIVGREAAEAVAQRIEALL